MRGGEHMNTYSLELDLAKGPLHTLKPNLSTVTLRQGDRQGCTITADIYDHGDRFTEAGLTAFFVMDLPDHAHYYRDEATYEDGTVTIVVDETYAASAAGTTDNAYFELLQGDEVVASTESFRVIVLKDARDGKTAGETYDPLIEQKLNEMAEAIASAEAATEAAQEAASRMGYNAYLDYDVVDGKAYLSVVTPD